MCASSCGSTDADEKIYESAGLEKDHVSLALAATVAGSWLQSLFVSVQAYAILEVRQLESDGKEPGEKLIKLRNPYVDRKLARWLLSAAC